MTRHAACDRARLWASLSVDAELSELERALLRAHAASCPACRRYARELEAIATELRSAPQGEPARPVWTEPRARRVAARRWQLGIAAASVAASLVAGGLAGRLTSAERPGNKPADASLATSWMFYTAYRSAPETALLVRRRSVPS